MPIKNRYYFPQAAQDAIRSNEVFYRTTGIPAIQEPILARMEAQRNSDLRKKKANDAKDYRKKDFNRKYNKQSKEQVEAQKLAQEFLQRARVSVKDDPYGERQYIKEKYGFDSGKDIAIDPNTHYRPKFEFIGLTGLANDVTRSLNNSFQYRDNVEIIPQATISSYNPNLVDFDKTWKLNNPIYNAITSSFAPIAMAAAAPSVATQFIKTPFNTAMTLLGTAGGASLGGSAVDKIISYNTNNKYDTFNSWMAESKLAKSNHWLTKPFKIFTSPFFSDLINPGSLAGGYMGGLGTDLLTTALTGKSQELTAPIRRKTIGKAYYNNITPMGYDKKPDFDTGESHGRKAEIARMALQTVFPMTLSRKINSPNYKPHWMKKKGYGFEVLRNDAHRLSVGLKPHYETSSTGKQIPLYYKNIYGSYSVNPEYIDIVKSKYAPTKYNFAINNPQGNGRITSKYHPEWSRPQEGMVVGSDVVTGNQGRAQYFYNPFEARWSGDQFTVPNAILADTWDVQPLIDDRTIAPRLSNFLRRAENMNIPVVSKAAHNFRNLEAVDLVGGKPFKELEVINRPITFHTNQ